MINQEIFALNKISFISTGNLKIIGYKWIRKDTNFVRFQG